MTESWAKVPRDLLEAACAVYPGGVYVLTALLTFAGTSGAMWPSVETLAEIVHRSERAVRRALKRYVAAGLLVAEPQRFKPTRYSVAPPDAYVRRTQTSDGQPSPLPPDVGVHEGWTPASDKETKEETTEENPLRGRSSKFKTARGTGKPRAAVLPPDADPKTLDSADLLRRAFGTWWAEANGGKTYPQTPDADRAAALALLSYHRTAKIGRAWREWTSDIVALYLQLEEKFYRGHPMSKLRNALPQLVAEVDT